MRALLGPAVFLLGLWSAAGCAAPAPAGQVLSPSAAPTVAARSTSMQPAHLTATASPPAQGSPSHALPSPSAEPTSSPPPVIAVENASELAPAASLRFEPWEMVTALSWSPEGRVLAAAVGSELVWIDPAGFSVLSRSPVGPLTHGLAFAPDGSRLAAASHDGQTRLWKLAPGAREGEQERAWEAHKRAANQAAFSPDGRLLATGGSDAMVRIWDLETGEAVQAIIGGTFAVPGLAFDASGEQLFIVNGSLVRVRVTADGRMSAALHPDEQANLYSLAVQGQSAAAGDASGRIWLWNLPAEKEVLAAGVLELSGSASPGLVWSLAFSPDGSLLAAAYGDGHLRLWNPSTGALLADLAAHTRPAAALAFSPDGRLLASGGLDGEIVFWAILD